MKKLWEVWSLGDKIGQGSFGEVYVANKKELGKEYFSAVKHISLPKTQDELGEIMREGYATTPDDILEYYKDTIDELVKEIKIMYELRANKNIVDYQDHLIIEKTDGEVGYDIYIRMELLTSLDKYLENKKLDEKDIVKLGLDITEALIVCNNHNFLHRDIKPANIFIDDNGTYKLGDFGVARKLEKTTYGMSKKGTYNYMSPEIYKGEKANISSDIYSLGIVMYRLLNNNKQPFIDKEKTVLKVSDNEEALMKRMNGEDIPDIKGVNKSLMQVIKKACAYDRKKRYNNPSEFKKDLEKIQNGEQVEADIDKNKIIEDELEKTVSIYSKGNSNTEGYTSDDELRSRIRKIIEEETLGGTLKNEKKYITVKTYVEKPEKKFVGLSFAICVILFILNLVLVPNAKGLFNAYYDKMSTDVFENYVGVIIITDFVVFISFCISLASRKIQKIASYFYLTNFITYIIMLIVLISNNYRVTYLYYLMILSNVLLYLINYRWSLKVISREVLETEKEQYKERDKKLEESYKNKFQTNKERTITLVAIIISFLTVFAFNLSPMKGQSNDIDSSRKQIKITDDFINIREKPTTKSAKKGIVYKGEIFTVIDEQEKKDGYGNNVIWYHIKTELGDEGYIVSYVSDPWVEIISEG